MEGRRLRDFIAKAGHPIPAKTLAAPQGITVIMRRRIVGRAHEGRHSLALGVAKY